MYSLMMLGVCSSRRLRKFPVAWLGYPWLPSQPACEPASLIYTMYFRDVMRHHDGRYLVDI